MLQGPYYRIGGEELTEDETRELFLALRERFEPQLTTVAAVVDRDWLSGRLETAINELHEKPEPKYKVGDVIRGGAGGDPAEHGVTKLRDGVGDILEHGRWDGSRGWSWRTIHDTEFGDHQMVSVDWEYFRHHTFTVVEVSG